jgi:hypothetical protein
MARPYFLQKVNPYESIAQPTTHILGVLLPGARAPPIRCFAERSRDGPMSIERPINNSAPLIMSAFGAEDRVQFKSKPNEHVPSRTSTARLRGDMYLSRSMCLSGGEVGLKSRARSLGVAPVCCMVRAALVVCMRRTRTNCHPNRQVSCMPRHRSCCMC